ncbi:MlaA family lipoprotein [Rhodovulum sp. DZ06]|uniref:MlaA family lipoprotein n=1 Tax=Rhodovulum sp. DZ06 TaxID=3425126 RepID=UPI003D32CFFD
MTLNAMIKAAAAAALAGLAACSTPEDPKAFAHDPYEGTNREIHDFNTGLDMVALRPAALLYDFVAPDLVKHLVGNGLNTLDTPGDVVNHLAQGEVMAAGRQTLRLGINLVLGLGVLDPATDFGLPPEETDFGITLARAGAEEGAYLAVPFLGPKTERDFAGTIVDAILDPVGVAAAAAGVPAAATIGRRALDVTDARSRNFDAVDRALYESEDSYVATRAAYLQIRRRAVAGGATAESLPDVFQE